MRKAHEHDGARPWRGIKRDQWEGGHRVPFLVRWPGQIPANSVSMQLTSLTDITATVAAISKIEIPDDAAEDSFDLFPAWLDPTHPQIRPYLLTQAFGGIRTLSIRKGAWKYIDHSGSGGNRYEADASLKAFEIPDDHPDAEGQLYDLASDPGERNNLFETFPERVAELKGLLEKSKVSGRSR